jgi:non-specific protein-tyrosine kinase
VIAAGVDQAMARDYPGYRLENHGLQVGGSGLASSQQTTQLMTIAVTDTIPTRAAAAADTVGKVFIDQVTALQRSRFVGAEQAIKRQLNQAQVNIQDVSQRIATYRGSAGGLDNLRAQLSAYQSIYQTLLSSDQEFNVNRDTALNGIKVFSPAGVPYTPISPHPTRTALLIAFVALMLGAGGIFVYDYFDDSPRTPEEVEEAVGAPILGTVQEFDKAKYDTNLISASHARSPLAEAYRMIRTNVQFTNIDHPARSIVVTSPLSAEGKSTTASNLANVFADAGCRVTLVDGDLRRPSLHRIFGIERQDGLTNMLAGGAELNGSGLKETSKPNLALIASGPVPPRPADLLGSARMKTLMTHLGEQADMILIDSPPLLAVTDAAVLSTVTDGVILVVDPARSKRRDLRRAREAIEAVGGRILGVVINRLDRASSSYYYYYYQHNYAYPYESYLEERETSDTKA